MENEQAECLVAAACGGQYDWRSLHLALVLQGGAQDGAKVYRPHVPLPTSPPFPPHHTHTTTTNTTQPFHASVPIFFCVACIVTMASGQPSRAAQRRRGRRKRAMLRHEQQSIAMALAAALHHSRRWSAAERRPTGTEDRRQDPTHAGLRAQKTPPQGERPGSLAEPAPQRSDRSLRLPCRLWRARQAMQWTPPPSASSRLLQARREEEKKKKKKKKKKAKEERKERLMLEIHRKVCADQPVTYSMARVAWHHFLLLVHCWEEEEEEEEEEEATSSHSSSSTRLSTSL